MIRRTVAKARTEENSLLRLLRDHLGPGAAGFPVVTGSWASYDHVNVQAGIDAWLAGPGREHHTVGLAGFRDQGFGLGDLLQDEPDDYGPRPGSLATVSVPAGPGGVTRRCVECAIFLIADGNGRAAVLVRGPSGMSSEVLVEVAAAEESSAQRAIDEIRERSVEHNVFRGQVISFSGEVFRRGIHFGPGAELSFVDRPRLDRDQVILPPELLDGIERQVLGIARHVGRLLASGQHLKRGVLLHGPPGTGKTHTVRYLLGQLPGVTVILLAGSAIGMVSDACSIARTLQPALVVLEDVDLIAEERDDSGQLPLLFQLLNDMDGLAEDADVAFLLTTNRADMLEPALAERPGRIDHAAELPLPDADARRRLIELYRGRLMLDLAEPDPLIARMEGVTASLVKELLRRAALVAAEEDGQDGRADAPLRLTDAHLTAALDQLLDARSELTRVLLGGHRRRQREAAAELADTPAD
jgi:hypothetical protein